MKSILVKKQVREFRGGQGTTYVIAYVRYDDQCGNGHNTFSITGEVYGPNGCERTVTFNGQKLSMESCGCVHAHIARHIPELKPYIKWHLCTSEGPHYYVENTMYWAREHGPTHAWIYYRGKKATDPLGLGDDGETERLLGYFKREEATKAEGQSGYRVEWDAKGNKKRNLVFARESAIWPEATDEELTQDPVILKMVLEARLPKLMEEFKQAVESLGFVF